MLRKVLVMFCLAIVCMANVALAADKTYNTPSNEVTITLPEQYIVTPVERNSNSNDELNIKVSQLSISDPSDKTFSMHLMVESNKLTVELPNLDYKPGDVMKNYFIDALEGDHWKEPSVIGTLQNGSFHFLKFSTYIADSIGQKYDGQIYATLKDGKLIYLMAMSRERPLSVTEKNILEQVVSTLVFN